MNMRDTTLPTTSEGTGLATDLFVTVPDTTLPNGTIVPSFQVGQYLCSLGADGKATVTAEGQPFVDVDYPTARQACANAGYALITETQALAIAHNIAQQGANWTGGKVGEGALYQGLRKGSWRGAAQPGAFVPSDPDEHRMFVLSNGETLCDAAGNAFTWVFDDVQGNENGIVARAFAKDSPSVTGAPFPSMQKGMGWIPDVGLDWSGDALVRGGCWFSDALAGVFRLRYGWPDYRSGNVGFRCTKPVGL